MRPGQLPAKPPAPDDKQERATLARAANFHGSTPPRVAPCAMSSTQRARAPHCSLAWMGVARSRLRRSSSQAKGAAGCGRRWALPTHGKQQLPGRVPARDGKAAFPSDLRLTLLMGFVALALPATPAGVHRPWCALRCSERGESRMRAEFGRPTPRPPDTSTADRASHHLGRPA